uniref:Retroviral polymerase SH3-like domain-containing protein n=1 Tax=Lactuca sativa TaxID=4236 RepID=A0A9R1XLE9_LACSA|nr:hypothetical protein LSAT_V11C400210890 [Lactuca sativa]
MCSKVWRYVAYYRTLDPKRNKLGARANKSIFIGYAHNSKAYQLLDIESMWNSRRTNFLGMMTTPVIQHLQVLLEKYSYLLLLWRTKEKY